MSLGVWLQGALAVSCLSAGATLLEFSVGQWCLMVGCVVWSLTLAEL